MFQKDFEVMLLLLIFVAVFVINPNFIANHICFDEK